MLPNATEFDWLENADLFMYFYPMLEVGFAHLRAGELFFWNPHQMSGMPGLATMQTGYLYPLHFVYLFLPTSIGMGVSAVLHMLLAAFGALALCRVWGLGWIASAAAGSYFALSSVLPVFGWPPGMEAQAWLPLGLLAIERIGLHDDRRAFPLLIAAVAMPFLAGGYQTSVGMYYCYALFMLGALVRRAAAERSVREWLPGVIASFVLATAIGVLLVAPQLLPTLELSRLGERQATALTLEHVMPNGRILHNLSLLAERLWVPAEPMIGLYTFLGLGGSVLAAAGIIRARGLSLPLVLITAFGVLSLYIPEWFFFLRETLPGIGWFRVPVREFFLANFGVSILLAFGLDQCITPERRSLSRWAAAGFALAMSAAGVVFLGEPDPRLLVAGLGMTAGVALCACLSSTPRRIGIAGAMAALLAYDTVGTRVNTKDVPYAIGQLERGYDQRGHDAEGLHRAVAQKAGYNRAIVVDHTTTKGPMLVGGYSPVDYDPLAISTFHSCTKRATESDLPNDKGAPEPLYLGAPYDLVALFSLPARRCLDLTSVRYAAVPSIVVAYAMPKQWSVSKTDLPLWAGKQVQYRYRLLENTNAVPRAFGVYASECLTSKEAQLDRVLEPSFNPKKTVVLAEGPGCETLSETSGKLPPPRVDIIDYQDTAVSIQAMLEKPGYLILTDSFYPGWTAELNGENVRILKANTMSRAVRVPAGPVSVVFRYEPTTFYAGCGLGLFGTLLGVLYWRRLAAR